MKKKTSLLVLAAGMLGALALTGCGGGGRSTPISEASISSSETIASYSFTAKGGEGYSISVTTSGISLVNGQASVEKGTTVSFLVNLAEDYKDSTPVVKSNGTVLTQNNDKTYSVVVNSDITITVEGVCQYFNVTFSSGEGYSFSDISVSLDSSSKAKVKANDIVTFKVNIAEDYDGTDALVKVGTKVLSPAADGKYSLTVTADTTVEVLGVTKKAAKYVVTFQSGAGFEYSNVSELLVDGAVEVTEGTEITFSLSALPGYNVANVVVKANDSVLGYNVENERYSITVTEATLIIVEGVEANSYTVSMADGNGYSFTDVTGVTLVDGVGFAHYGDVVTFKVNIDDAYEKTSDFKVSVAGNKIVPADEVYAFTVQDNASVLVEGLVKGEEVVVEKMVASEEGTASEDVYAERGYHYATSYAGGYRTVSLKDIYLGQYDMLRFAVKGSDADNYIEYIYEGNDIIGTHTGEWKEFFLVKEQPSDDEIGFRLYEGSYDGTGWRNIFLPVETFLNEITVKLGFCDSYLISEIIGRKDMDYVPAEKEISFVESANPLHTISVDGQTVSSATGKVGEPFTFKVTPNDGAACTVSFNGKTIAGDSENNYTIIVANTNVITITDCAVISNVVLKDATYDEESNTSTLTSSWHIFNAFAATTSLSQYSRVFFTATFSVGGWFGFGSSDGGWEVSKDFMADTQYNFVITKAEGDNAYVITCQENAESWNLTIENEDLSNVAFGYQDSLGNNCTATFSPLYGEIA